MFSAILLSISAAALAQNLNEQNSAWFGPSVSGACYFAERHNLLSFEKAAQYCANYSAKLPTLGADKHADPEAEFNFMTENGDSILQIPHRPHWQDSFWLAYTDEKEEDVWVTTDGEAISEWTKWFRGEPNGRRTQNCLCAVKNVEWQWDDQDCAQPLEVICQRWTTCTLKNKEGVSSKITANAGQTLKVECQGGYRLIGDSVIACQCDGRFNDECTACVKAPEDITVHEDVPLSCLPSEDDACDTCVCGSSVTATVFVTILFVAASAVAAAVFLWRMPHMKQYVPFM